MTNLKKIQIVSTVLFHSLIIALATSLGAMETLSFISVLWSVVIFRHCRLAFIEMASTRYFLAATFGAISFLIFCILPLLADSVPKDFLVDALRHSRWIIYCFCLGLLVLELGERSREMAQRSVITGLLVAGMVGLVQLFHGPALAETGSWLIPDALHYRGSVIRATGFFNLPQAFAGVMGMLGLMLMPYCLGMSQMGVNRWSWRGAFSLLAVLLACISVVASGTRGAYMALTCSIIALALMMMRFQLMRRGLALFLCGLTGMGFLGVVLVSYEAMDLAPISYYVTNDASFQVREALTRAYLAMVADHPLLGTGLGYSAGLLLEYYPQVGVMDGNFVGHAHSNYLQALVDGGLAGLLAYLVLIGSFIWWNFCLFRDAQTASLKRFLLGLMAAQFYFHLVGLVESNFIDLKVNHTLIFVWGLVIGEGALSRGGRSAPDSAVGAQVQYAK